MVPDATTTPTNTQPSAKWREAAQAGFQLLPDVLVKNQHRLGLTPTDLVVLINVTMHWWYADVKPFPRTTTIAARMGVDVRTVQRSLRRLEAMHFLERKTEKTDSGELLVFDLSGLVNILDQLAIADPSYRPNLRKVSNAPAPAP